MGASLAAATLLLMRRMHGDKQLNLVILAGAAAVFAASLVMGPNRAVSSTWPKWSRR